MTQVFTIAQLYELLKEGKLTIDVNNIRKDKAVTNAAWFNFLINGKPFALKLNQYTTSAGIKPIEGEKKRMSEFKPALQSSFETMSLEDRKFWLLLEQELRAVMAESIGKGDFKNTFGSGRNISIPIQLKLMKDKDGNFYSPDERPDLEFPVVRFSMRSDKNTRKLRIPVKDLDKAYRENGKVVVPLATVDDSEVTIDNIHKFFTYGSEYTTQLNISGSIYKDGFSAQFNVSKYLWGRSKVANDDTDNFDDDELNDILGDVPQVTTNVEQVNAVHADPSLENEAARLAEQLTI